MCLSGDVEFGLFSIKPSAETLPHIESPEMPPPKKRRQRWKCRKKLALWGLPPKVNSLHTLLNFLWNLSIWLNVNSSSRATNSCKHRIKREHELQIDIFLNVWKVSPDSDHIAQFICFPFSCSFSPVLISVKFKWQNAQINVWLKVFYP